MKGLISIQNKFNECLRWCLVIYLNSENKNPSKIGSIDIEVAKKHFNGVKFPVHRNDYTKIEKKNLINVFGYEDETTYCNYTLKQSFEINVDLLLLSISENSHFVLIRYFNRFVANTTKNHC